jgi:hypothetical protein
VLVWNGVVAPKRETDAGAPGVMRPSIWYLRPADHRLAAKAKANRSRCAAIGEI